MNINGHALVFAAIAVGCMPAKAPREQARAVVLTLAEGVHQADLTCSEVAISTHNLGLAVKCAALVSESRTILISAESALDASDALAADNLPCLVQSASAVLSNIVDAIQDAGGKVPAVVADAMKFAPVLGGACHG